jgi:tetratricopeptide (TPR) repeat protein
MKGHYRRGVSLLQLGRHGEAVRALEIAVRLAPNDQEVRRRLEEAQAELRRVEKERRLAGEHLPSKGYAAEKEEGNRLYKEGKYDQAVAAYTRALQSATTDEERAVVLSNRAAALSQQKCAFSFSSFSSPDLVSPTTPTPTFSLFLPSLASPLADVWR